jgi:hypothetical protein
MPAGPGDDAYGRVLIRAFGRPWLLRDVPALDWILGAGEPGLAGIFPGLVDDDDSYAAFVIFSSGHDPDTDLRGLRAARVALERAGRREWFWTYNLIDECLQSWTQVNGLLVRQGVWADRTSLPDWLDAAFTQILELYHDKKERTAFETRLRKVPKDALGTVKPKFSDRNALMAFAAP